MDKKAWRDELLRRRGSLPVSFRREATRRIILSVLSLPELEAAKTIALYADFRHEVPTVRLGYLLARAGKAVALPSTNRSTKQLTFHRVSHRRQLCPGPYGIKEPGPDCAAVPAGDLDLIIVPGVGFDRVGHRLGYGAGYYDRFLPSLNPACIVIGLAFACQVVPLLPHGPLDRPVDLVVTESEVFKAGRKGTVTR